MQGEYILTNESEKWDISICGLNCAKCDIYQACHGDDRLRNEIVEWFKKERNEDLKPEQIVCEGCRGARDRHWSPDCGMMNCALERGLQYCFECEEFPCKIVNEFGSDGVSHHERTIENMKRMKEIGLEAWIEEQKKVQCVFCP